MNKEQIEAIEKLLGTGLSKQALLQFNDYEKLFKIYNSHTNLISKNDENFFF